MDAYDERIEQRRICWVVVLVPVVCVSLLLETMAGWSMAAWGYIHYQPTNRGVVVAGSVIAAIGPVALVVATLWTRSMRELTTSRVLRIEVWTLIGALPGALLLIVGATAAAVI